MYIIIQSCVQVAPSINGKTLHKNNIFKIINYNRITFHLNKSI